MQCFVPLGQRQLFCIFHGTGILLFTFSLTELISPLPLLWNWHVLVYFQPYRTYISAASSVELTCFGLLSTLQNLYLRCLFCGTDMFWFTFNLTELISPLPLLWNWHVLVYFQPYRTYISAASSVELTCFGLLSTLQNLYLRCLFCGTDMFWFTFNLTEIISAQHLLWNWLGLDFFHPCSHNW